MQQRRLIAGLVVVVALALPVWAQQVISEEEYSTTMRGIRATVGGVGDHMTAQSKAEVAADGKNLSEAFAKIEAFWKARDKEDAVGWATEAMNAAKEMESAGNAGNFDAAATAFGNLRGACMPCHNQYRERTENGFRIKSGR